jgi:hypothetical protein
MSETPRTPRLTLSKAPAQAGEEATTVELHDTRCCGFLRAAKMPDWLPAGLPSLLGMSAVLLQATYAIFTTIVTVRRSLLRLARALHGGHACESHQGAAGATHHLGHQS